MSSDFKVAEAAGSFLQFVLQPAVSPKDIKLIVDKVAATLDRQVARSCLNEQMLE